jgi:hypothetical protein
MRFGLLCANVLRANTAARLTCCMFKVKISNNMLIPNNMANKPKIIQKKKRVIAIDLEIKV